MVLVAGFDFVTLCLPLELVLVRGWTTEFTFTEILLLCSSISVKVNLNL